MSDGAGENKWRKEGDDWLSSDKESHLSVGSIGGSRSAVDGHLSVLRKASEYFK